MAVGAIAVVNTCRHDPWVLALMPGERRPAGAEVTVGQSDECLLDTLMRAVEALNCEGPP
jgi:hypothetical protein